MQIKEFLDTEKDYVLVKDTYKRSEDWIEVPEGAIKFIKSNEGASHFVSNNGQFMADYDIKNGRGYWYDSAVTIEYYMTFMDGITLWQRPQQPESLPFIDDEVQSINDQYAEIEQVRQVGLKFDNGKLRHSLLPKDSISSIIAVLEFGAKKYEANNWQKVDNAKDRYYDAAMRHIDSWWNGEKFDQETGIHHLAHAATNLFFLKWFDDKENNNG